MVHAGKVSGENGGFASASSAANFHDRVALFIFIRWQQRDMNVALYILSAVINCGFARPDIYVRATKTALDKSSFKRFSGATSLIYTHLTVVQVLVITNNYLPITNS